MYNRILVPMDGSTHAQNALKHASSLVKELGSRSNIIVLHVNPALHLISDVGLTIDVDHVLAEEGKQVLEPAVNELKEAGLVCEALSIKGDPAQQICEQAKKLDCDLIVMGSRGLGAFSEVVLGSVSHKVIQHAACPVLIVK